jgi:Leucine Rich repeat
LSDNYIGDRGVVSLVGSLLGNHGLRVLDLSDNVIGESGVVSLGASLPASRMRVLTLGPVTDDGGEALVKGARFCLSLEECRIRTVDHQQELKVILREHERTRSRSRSATKCLLWCYAQLQRNPQVRAGDPVSLRSIPHAIVLQIAALVRVPRTHPPSNAVQLAQEAQTARDELASQHPGSDGKDLGPVLKRPRFEGPQDRPRE